MCKGDGGALPILSIFLIIHENEIIWSQRDQIISFSLDI